MFWLNPPMSMNSRIVGKRLRNGRSKDKKKCNSAGRKNRKSVMSFEKTVMNVGMQSKIDDRTDGKKLEIVGRTKGKSVMSEKMQGRINGRTASRSLKVVVMIARKIARGEEMRSKTGRRTEGRIFKNVEVGEIVGGKTSDEQGEDRADKIRTGQGAAGKPPPHD